MTEIQETVRRRGVMGPVVWNPILATNCLLPHLDRLRILRFPRLFQRYQYTSASRKRPS